MALSPRPTRPQRPFTLAPFTSRLHRRLVSSTADLPPTSTLYAAKGPCTQNATHTRHSAKVRVRVRDREVRVRVQDREVRVESCSKRRRALGVVLRMRGVAVMACAQGPATVLYPSPQLAWLLVSSRLSRKQQCVRGIQHSPPVFAAL